MQTLFSTLPQNTVRCICGATHQLKFRVNPLNVSGEWQIKSPNGSIQTISFGNPIIIRCQCGTEIFPSPASMDHIRRSATQKLRDATNRFESGWIAKKPGMFTVALQASFF